MEPLNAAALLTWRSLTAIINKRDAPANFLKNFLFSSERMSPHRHIDLSEYIGDRQTLPFAKRCGAAVLLESIEEQMRSITPAHIRVKKGIRPCDVLNRRMAGTPVYMEERGMEQAIADYLSRESNDTMERIENTEEWLCSQVLTGSATYDSVGLGDGQAVSFEINTGRDAAHDILLGGGAEWSLTTGDPAATILTVQKLTNESKEGTIPTDIILGADAIQPFLDRIKGDARFQDGRSIMTPAFQGFLESFRESGAIFLGTYLHNTRVWGYCRKVRHQGSDVDLIRPKFAEFVHRGPRAQMVMHYGGIEDLNVLEGNLLAEKRFAKSWVEEDSPQRQMLVETNPLPFVGGADSSASVQVIP